MFRMMEYVVRPTLYFHNALWDASSTLKRMQQSSLHIQYPSKLVYTLVSALYRASGVVLGTAFGALKMSSFPIFK